MKLNISVQKILPLLCWSILLIPNIMTMCISKHLIYSIPREVAYLAIVIFLFLFPAAFLRRKTYFIVEGIIGLLCMPIEIASLYLNGDSVSVSFVSVIFGTNRIEAMEVVQSTTSVVLIYIALGVVYGISVYKMKNDPLLPRHISRIILINAFILFALLTLGAFWARSVTSSSNYLIQKVANITNYVSSKFRKVYPYDIYVNIRDMIRQNRDTRELIACMGDFSFGLEPKTDDLEEHYVLVFGESARYDRFSLNGYHRCTSPSMDTVSYLFSLSNIFSQANLTSSSLPILLTRADCYQMDIAQKEKTIIDAFEEVGFQTAWLSNQINSSFEERIAKNATYEYHVQCDYAYGHAEYDGTLVDQLNTLFQEHPSRKTFHVLHFMGCHYKYNERYPPEFECFQPTLRPSDGYSIFSEQEKNVLDNTYDNTIIYTDYVLSQILCLLQEQKGVRGLVFVSDHGENLCDDEKNLSGHGSYDGTIYESHIPCFIWLSPEFRKTYPEKVAALTNNIDIQISSDIIFYSLADLGGLNAVVDSGKSIFSSQLRQQDKIEMLNGRGTITRIK